MAFGIKAIKKILSDNGMPLENLEAAASEICGRHNTDMESMKEERDSYKQEAETIAELKNQLKEANDKIESFEKDDYKTKYESEKAEHDKLKEDVSGRETHAKKETFLYNYLKGLKYSEESAKLIVKHGGYVDRIELDENGNSPNIESIRGEIQSDFAICTPKETIKSSAHDNPPVNAGGKATKTKSEIMKIKDTSERQKAILENRDAFGF